MKKNLLIISAGLLIPGAILCMDQTNKKAKTSSSSEPFPAWKWEVDGAIQKGDTKAFAALAEKHDIKDQTLISSLPGLALIALGPKKTRIAMATILLDRSANIDQTSPDPIAGSTTALGWACIEGDEQFAKFLIARGAKIQRPHDTKRHPLTLTIKYHPTNVSLIKTVMQAAHNQQTLPAVIANTQDYFNNNHLSQERSKHRDEVEHRLGLLKNYQREIENSHSTSSTRDAQ